MNTRGWRSPCCNGVADLLLKSSPGPDQVLSDDARGFQRSLLHRL